MSAGVKEALLGEGDKVQFEILSAEHTTARSSGAEMLKLKLRVTNEDGATAVIKEHVMIGQQGRMGAFLRAIGRQDEQRHEPETWEGIKGFATLGYEGPRVDAKGREWAAKWRIHHWGTGASGPPVTECRPRQGAGDPITRAERTGVTVQAAAVAVLNRERLPLQPIDETARQQAHTIGAKFFAMGNWAREQGIEMPDNLPAAQLIAEYDAKIGWAHLGPRYHDGPAPVVQAPAIVGALPGFAAKDEVPL